MPLIKVPLLPQWNASNSHCVSTPDGGFLYVGLRSVNYIGQIKKEINEPLIRSFHVRQGVISLDVDSHWPRSYSTEDSTPSSSIQVKSVDGIPNINKKAEKTLPMRIFAIITEDNSIQIWDFDKGSAIQGHKAHCDIGKTCMDGPIMQPKTNILISYMSNRNLLSMDKYNMVIYCITSNTYYRCPIFMSLRSAITILKCSPFNENQFAIGTNDGVILLCDLQQKSILRTFRGHNTTVTSIAWKKIHLIEQIKPKLKQQKTNKNISKFHGTKHVARVLRSDINIDADDIFDVYDYNYLNNEFGTSNEGGMMKSITIPNFMCNEREGSSLPTKHFNFVEACKNLEDDIRAEQQQQQEQDADEDGDGNGDGDGDGQHSSSNDSIEINHSNENIVTLAECKEAAALQQQNIFSSTLSSSLSTMNNYEQHHQQQQGNDTSDEIYDEDLNELTSSTEYLNAMHHSSSDDSLDVDGCISKIKKKVVLHQAEVHTVQRIGELEQPPDNQECRQLTEGQEILIKNDMMNINEEKRQRQHHYRYHHDRHGRYYHHNDNNKKYESLRDDKPGDILLASMSADGCLWLWNASSGSACDYHVTEDKKGSKPDNNLYVRWTNLNNLITSNKVGNLQYWSVKSFTTQNGLYKLCELKRKNQFHHRVMSFDVCQTKPLLWCILLNKEIKMENMQKRKVLVNLDCCSFDIRVLKECPNNGNTIAMGLSNRSIGIIDLSVATPSKIKIKRFTQRVESAVTSLCWSPDCTSIAYGTSEGRLGIIKAMVTRQMPNTFKLTSGKPIHAICWQDKYLYVICNERIAVYEDGNYDKDAFVIPNIIGVSNITFYEKYLFVGTQNGQLHIYKLNEMLYDHFSYTIVRRIELTSRYITDMQWCPISIKPKLAIASCSNLVYIINFNAADGTIMILNKITMKPLKMLNTCVKWSNHNENRFLSCGSDGTVRIWDALNNSNKDNTTNIKEYFIKYYDCPMKCGLFLSNDDNIVICSGKSTTLEMFDIRLEQQKEHLSGNNKSNGSDIDGDKDDTNDGSDDEHGGGRGGGDGAGCSSSNRYGVINGTNKNTKKRRKTRTNNIQWATKALTQSNVRQQSAAVSVKGSHHEMTTTEIMNENCIKKICVDSDADVNYKRLEIVDNARQLPMMFNKMNLQANSTLSRTTSFMKTPRTLMFLSTSEMNKNALSAIHGILITQGDCHPSDPPNNSVFLCSKLYGTKDEAKELLNEELKNVLNTDTNCIGSVFMSHLTINLKDEIMNCIRSKKLTAWHVSQAPSISYAFWQQCCLAFGQQLLDEGYVLQAATYFLAIHKTNETINMLLTKKYYREALLIARIHLEEDDPLFELINEQWINYLSDNGHMLGAALLCLLIDQKVRCYEYLTKIRNITQELKEVINLLENDI